MTIISNFTDKFDRTESKHVEQTYGFVKHNHDYHKESNFLTGKKKETETSSWTATDDGIKIAEVIFKLLLKHKSKLISQGMKLLKK